MTDRAPRVFVVHEQTSLVRREGSRDLVEVNKDLSPAERFGELVRVVPIGRHGPDRQEAIVALIERALDDMTEDDYLLPIGDVDWIMTAGAVAAWNLGGRFRYLHWVQPSVDIDDDGNKVRIRGRYEAREMVIPSMIDDAPADLEDFSRSS
jgi:hypothetical protein